MNEADTSGLLAELRREAAFLLAQNNMESAYEGDITMEHAVNIDFVGGLIGQDSGSGGTLAIGGWTG